MQGPDESNDGEVDYLSRPSSPTSSGRTNDSDDNPPQLGRSLRRSRRMRLIDTQNLENTDHDYFGHGGVRGVADDDTDTEALENEEENLAEVPELRYPLEERAEVDADENASDNANDQLPQELDAEPVQVEAHVELEAAEPNVAGTSAGANPINLVSPSPPKKRKRISLGTPKSNTPKVKAKNENGDDDNGEEDDGLTCPICLDTWEMSGPHRLVSLRCGHLFGDSCIRRWLNESARQSGVKVCPQCKTKATNRDLRCLYAKRLRAIDRSEEHRLREELDKERDRCRDLQLELVTLKMSYTAKFQKLESENVRMKLLLRSGNGAGSNFGLDPSDPQIIERLQSYKLFMDYNIDISREPGCRVLVHSEQQSSIIASQKSAQGLFPGYGVRFINTPTFRTSNFLHTSAKLVRDICLSADEQLLAVASMETRVKLFDLRTRQVTSVFAPSSEKCLWACAMDRNTRDNCLYLGAAHGCTYAYDIRFPETVLEEYKTEGDLSPVINIAPVLAGKIFPNGGFLVCKLQSIWFYEYPCSSVTSTAIPTRLNIEGPFSSMNFDTTQETLLVAARTSSRHPQSRYMLGRLDKIDGMPVFNVKVNFSGSKATPVMTRCSQVAVEANTLIAGYIQDVKLLALFDVRREQRVQSLPVQEVVYDICPIYLAQSTYLAALTETKCRIYKLSSSSG